MLFCEYLDARASSGSVDELFAVERQYYGQFVPPSALDVLDSLYGRDKFAASRDPFQFDDIPQEVLDLLAERIPVRDSFAAFGDTPTPAGVRAIVKEAALQLIERGEN